MCLLWGLQMGLPGQVWGVVFAYQARCTCWCTKASKRNQCVMTMLHAHLLNRREGYITLLHYLPVTLEAGFQLYLQVLCTACTACTVEVRLWRCMSGHGALVSISLFLLFSGTAARHSGWSSYRPFPLSLANTLHRSACCPPFWTAWPTRTTACATPR